MNRIAYLAAAVIIGGGPASPTVSAQSLDSPQSRLRPIGSPSAVDQYRLPDQRSDYRETAVRQRGHVQPAQFTLEGTPPLPNRSDVALPPGFSPPPVNSPSAASTPPSLSPPPGVGRTLPTNPIAVPQRTTATTSPAVVTPSVANSMHNRDYAPLAQPRLNNQFATLDNSCHVSAPSRYSAASASGCCAPVSYQAPPAYLAPQAPVAPPAVIAPAAPAAVPLPGAPLGAAPSGAPAGALLSFGQERYPVQVGQGLFGQPVAYVPGQTFRNWIRYIFP